MSSDHDKISSEVEHVGFTGTRTGLSSKQRHSLRVVLAHLKEDGAVWFHHGDCEGADEEAHEVAVALGYRIHVHPPVIETHQANTVLDVPLMDRLDAPASYMVRNQAIVNACSVLIACPQQDRVMLSSGLVNTQRSGTWSTIRKAAKTNKPRVIVYSDGTIEHL